MAQIPALVISTAAGIVVSRVATDEDIGQQLVGQLFSKPQVLLITAGILGIMGLIPGMPNFAFLLLGRSAGTAATRMSKRPAAAPEPQLPRRKQPAAEVRRRGELERRRCRWIRWGWRSATA